MLFVLTGAGLSAESGLATFRDKQAGIWARYDPMALATPEAFAADPVLVHAFYDARRAAVQRAAPNAAHAALTRLQAGQDGVVLCTQNVDDLLERAGCRSVWHMHGSLLEGRCLACGAVSEWHGPMGKGAGCTACRAVGRMRPNVVWFGETPMWLDEIDAALRRASLFVAIGTSGTVYPAAGFVDMARASGCATAEMNLAASARTGVFDVVCEGPATRTVPVWVDRVLAGEDALGAMRD